MKGTLNNLIGCSYGFQISQIKFAVFVEITNVRKYQWSHWNNKKKSFQ